MKDLSNISSKKTIAALIIGSLLMPSQAKADNPIFVAVIGASATLGAAAIGGIAIIVASGALEDDKGEGGEAGGGEVIAPGTGGGDQGGGDQGGGDEQKRTLGELDLPAAVRGYVDRDIIISASSLPSASGSGTQEVTGTANYKFEGDIKKSKPGIKRFNLKDKLIFRFNVANTEKAEDATLILKVHELKLSTENVAKTKGYSKIQFTAIQDGNELWHWSAHVNQGEMPKIEGSSVISKAVVRKENDLMVIRDLKVPIKYKAPGAKGKTLVDIIVNVEGEGART